MDKEKVKELFEKWIEILRLRNNWDVKLEIISDEKKGDAGEFMIEPNERKAIIVINLLNPKKENLEEIICHELLHLKMYPLDQFTESLIDGHYIIETPEYETTYMQFMSVLEQTVEELTKCYLGVFGENKELSYGKCREMGNFNNLYNGLKSLK